MRLTISATAVVLAATAAWHLPALAESEGDDDGRGPSVETPRPLHDVSCRLRTKGAVSPGAAVSTRIVAVNRTRSREPAVVLALYADSTSSTPLWTGTVALGPRGRASRRVTVDVPSGATSLVAVASCPSDGNAGNDFDVVRFGSGGGGSPVPSGPQPSVSALAGAATYASNCASCHGADARGTSLAPRIVGRSAGSVFEAMREGEDGMPRFSWLTTTDARNLAAFLADPTVSPPTVPVTPPPSGGATPTYAGEIAPLLAANCTACHLGSNAPAGIRLDTLASAKANASRALAAMQAGRMPPAGPLPTASVQLFADWIAGGRK